MSEKIKGFEITLKNDISEGNVKRLVDALSCFENIVSVRPITTKFDDRTTQLRERHRIRDLFEKWSYDNLWDMNE